MFKFAVCSKITLSYSAKYTYIVIQFVARIVGFTCIVVECALHLFTLYNVQFSVLESLNNIT